MNTKLINILVLSICFVMLLFTLFFLAEHVDYFTTRTLDSATITSIMQKDSKKGSFANLKFEDKFRKKIATENVSISYGLSKELLNKKKVDIYYTKYFSQVLIKGYENPRVLILLLDLFLLLLYYIGIKAGLKGLKKITAS